MTRTYLLNYIRQSRVFTLVISSKLVKKIGWKKGDNIKQTIKDSKIILEKVEV